MSGGHVIALCGGVGAAKLAFGPARRLPHECLSVVINKGDDFRHAGPKGPASKLMRELGVMAGAAGLAAHYAGLLYGLIIDEVDASEAERLRANALQALVTGTVVHSEEDRARLAGEARHFAEGLKVAA